MLNNLLRWLRGGVKETPFELECINLCLEQLPEHLKFIALKQISEYNLVQREFDHRTLNYYKVSAFRKVLNPSELLPMKSNDCVLVRLVVETQEKEKINVVMHAVGYRVFCICFNKSVSHLGYCTKLNTCSVTHSWRASI